MKPLLASAVEALPDVTILNRVNITDYLIEDNEIKGAIGFSIEEHKAYVIRAKKVLCATGGAAGLYRPNNPGFSRHKMWYPPFNTGAGFAMGILGGAEMTTFEMRFIALRCKDTIAPTGTIAQGVGAKQVNSLGEVYETKYGLTTSERVYGTVMENLQGRGPCYLRTEGISEEQNESFVTFPFVSREIIPVLNVQGKDEEEAAALMGAKGFTIFRKITFPHMKWGLIYGIILCTARALGEFGAVNALSKTRGETFTLPLEIDALYMSGTKTSITAAFAVSSILVILAIILLIARNIIEHRGKEKEPKGTR